MGIFYKQCNSIPEFRINLPGEDPSGSKVFFFFFFLMAPYPEQKNWELDPSWFVNETVFKKQKRLFEVCF